MSNFEHNLQDKTSKNKESFSSDEKQIFINKINRISDDIKNDFMLNPYNKDEITPVLNGKNFNFNDYDISTKRKIWNIVENFFNKCFCWWFW